MKSEKILNLLIAILLSNFSIQAQNLKLKDADAWKYMHMLSPEEMNTKVKIERDFKVTVPPPAPVESLAEFEPMAGVLITYPGELRFNLLADITQKDTLYVLLVNDSEDLKKIFYNALGLYEYDNSRIKFVVAGFNSHWIRDYGPMFIAGKDSIGITDFTYNRVRPNDNMIPLKIAQEYSFPYYEMDLIHTGGNYMSDGYRIAASTQIAYTENSVSPEDVNKKMKDYLGIHTYHVVQDPNNEYINHIDCWGKFLDVDKILIRSVPQSHPQYDEIEATADYFKNQKSSWGNNYQVYRVNTPNNEPYTNSFILNKRVFVPIMNGQWDSDALQVYKEAMPGYEITGFNGTWGSTDALHCRVHEMADKQMVRIKHIPIRGAQGSKTDFTFKAAIKAYSGNPFKQDSVRLFYKVDFGEWQSMKMQQVSLDTFSVNLSAVSPNQTIQYYIYAADQAEKRAQLPMVGGAAPFTFVTSDVYTNAQNDIATNDIKVYPNPVHDWLTISINKSNSENIRLDFYNSKGQKINISVEKTSENSFKINTSSLQRGIYILRIQSDKSQKSIKISKE